MQFLGTRWRNSETLLIYSHLIHLIAIQMYLFTFWPPCVLWVPKFNTWVYCICTAFYCSWQYVIETGRIVIVEAHLVLSMFSLYYVPWSSTWNEWNYLPSSVTVCIKRHPVLTVWNVSLISISVRTHSVQNVCCDTHIILSVDFCALFS